MLNRRGFLKASAGVSALSLALPFPAEAAQRRGVELAATRGSIDAGEWGVQPGTSDESGRAFSRMLAEAADRNMPMFLPPGVYVLSNLELPRAVRLQGVPGATRIVYGGDGYLFLGGHEVERFELSGLVIDGANRWLADQAQGLIDLRRVGVVRLDDCVLIGSSRNALALEGVAGRVERSTFSGAADSGIFAAESAGLTIAGNTVTDCGNGGILVHRWQPAEDGTIISGNRVERIGARNGGTGQNGNGINLFRAGGVQVTGNQVADCAFSAIRANGSGNALIAQNTCLRSGETAIYSEFSFEGAVIAGNIVDFAANGISIANLDQGGRLATCSGNLVRNLSLDGPYPAESAGFGIGISIEADTSVTGNVVEDAPAYGLNIGWGAFMRNVTATGNVIRRTGIGVGVTVVEGAGSAVISGNLVSEAPGGAVVGHRWGEKVTEDLAATGAAAFPNLLIERNRAV
ncbi:MAG TPA: TIGR03808 family TAT-translocated repetitive protein [Mesorhizobium sp.]|jgi:uncharacterized secreted repeat protein (TIGR03808 family)|nr:TIGR03808 family TAT-translocated repetitive protein [Mesorhizobium sp.]